MKILLTEGCEFYREGMRQVIKNLGHKVDCAESREHLCKLFSFNYDLMIFDLDMLESLAIDLAQKVYHTTNPYIKKPTKIIATYKDKVEYYLGYLFDGSLKKPFTPEKLLEIINKENINVKKFNNKRSLRTSRFITNSRLVQY